MKTVRLKEMESYLSEKKSATVSELCERFNIHPNTARADIRELAEKGVVQKKYGCINYVATSPLISFVERQEYNQKEKKAIGRAAAQFLVEDDVIFVDAGTTTLLLFQDEQALPKNMTVITNNLGVIFWLVHNTDYSVFVLPGKVNRKLNAFASFETIESLKTYNIKKAFIGTRGISKRGELTSTSSIDAKLKKTAVEISETVILMADSKKLNQTSLFNFSSLFEVDYWCCDSVGEEITALARKTNVKLL